MASTWTSLITKDLRAAPSVQRRCVKQAVTQIGQELQQGNLKI